MQPHNIEHVLVLSTSHAPSPRPEFGDLTMANYDEGWVVFVRDAEARKERPVPAWIEPIMQKANEHHCTLILFDRDADEDDDFTGYSW